MAKGWGKSPLAAFIAIEEFVGPSASTAGAPMATRSGGRGTTRGSRSRPCPRIRPTTPTPRSSRCCRPTMAAPRSRCGIDNGRTRLYLTGRPGRLEPVTAAAGSREGQRLTFAVLDETHLWTRRNGGVKLAGTLRRNAAKMGGRTLETTNAPLLGEKSVAEQSGLAPGVMHYARRPSKEPDPRGRTKAPRGARETTATPTGSTSVGSSRRCATRRRTGTTRSGSTSTSGPRAPGERSIPGAGTTSASPATSQPDAHRLGFDGSISRDATVLRGCTADGYSFNLGIWQPTHGPRATWCRGSTSTRRSAGRSPTTTSG
jgi:hypothetical protein